MGVRSKGIPDRSGPRKEGSSGFTSVDGVMTYNNKDGTSIRTRDVDMEDGFWVAPVLTIILSVTAAFTGPDTSGTIFFVFVLALLTAALRAREDNEDMASVWTELGLLAVAAGLFWHPSGVPAFFIGAGGLMVLARYAYLWKERRAWEPFVCSLTILSLLALAQYGILPDRTAQSLFVFPAFLGAIGAFVMIMSCIMNKHGRSQLSD